MQPCRMSAASCRDHERYVQTNMKAIHLAAAWGDTTKALKYESCQTGGGATLRLDGKVQRIFSIIFRVICSVLSVIATIAARLSTSCISPRIPSLIQSIFWAIACNIGFLAESKDVVYRKIFGMAPRIYGVGTVTGNAYYQENKEIPILPRAFITAASQGTSSPFAGACLKSTAMPGQPATKFLTMPFTYRI